MCGIVGVIDETLPASELLPIVQRMTAEIVHRGPDDDGFFVADGVGLGHAPPEHHRPGRRETTDRQ